MINSAGAHPATFGQMRDFGPLTTARFDPHPEPAAAGSGELVSYAAVDLATALAERFQHTRLVHRNDPARPTVLAWFPIRALSLLDVAGAGALPLGLSHAVSGYREDVARRWARALRTAFPAADGLSYASSMTGERCVALWSPAANSYPAKAAIARSPDEPVAAWQDLLRNECARIGYTLL